MNQNTAMARRYHWHSRDVQSFVSDPQTAIVGRNQGLLTNLSDLRAEPAQRCIVDFLKAHPDVQLSELRHLYMEGHHDIRSADVNSKRLGAVLALAYERQCEDFTQALLLPGLGPRTLQSLALVSEVIYGSPARFDDPAGFSFAHGGKDGHPFPVPLAVYDESIEVLKKAVGKAKIGRSERLEGLRKLSQMARTIEDFSNPEADVFKVIKKERKESYRHRGRTVSGWAVKPSKSDDGQLELF